MPGVSSRSEFSLHVINIWLQFGVVVKFNINDEHDSRFTTLVSFGYKASNSVTHNILKVDNPATNNAQILFSYRLVKM